MQLIEIMWDIILEMKNQKTKKSVYLETWILKKRNLRLMAKATTSIQKSPQYVPLLRATSAT